MGYGASNANQRLIGTKATRLGLTVNEFPSGTEFQENDTGLTYILSDERRWALYKDTSQSGLAERLMASILKSLNVDSLGCLRVNAITVASHAVSTVTTLTNANTVSAVTTLTNWGLRTTTAITQQESFTAFQSGYRRNLVHL